MRMWGCDDINKHLEYMNLRIWGFEDSRITASTRSTWNWEYEYARMERYQQAHRIHEPKDKRMWGYKVTSKHTPTWAYEEARMQARAHESEDMRM